MPLMRWSGAAPRKAFFWLAGVCVLASIATLSIGQSKPPARNPRAGKKAAPIGQRAVAGPATNETSPDGVDYEPYAIYASNAPRAKAADPIETKLPLQLKKGDHIAFIGNALLDFDRRYGYIETLLQQRFPDLQLVFRNLSWPADEPGLQPRPANFADTEQHLAHEKADVIFAAFGFNESFAGESGEASFKKRLSDYITSLKAKAFNGKTGPQIVLLSPIPSQDVPNIPAAVNNARIQRYAEVVKAVAAEQKVAYLDLYTPMLKQMASAKSPLTVNGVHLNEQGYALLAQSVFEGLTGEKPKTISETLRGVVVDKETQYERRFRPLNTFYYTGDRSRDYGYLDFLPAMRNFDLMVENRDHAIWDLAAGKTLATAAVDDSKIPAMPPGKQSRGVNEWLKAPDELAAFKVDPRFEVNLFAGEEQFPDAAKPIQMRWDAKGRLWVSCSTTYPHVYPGREPNDKIIILEDTDHDGKADKSTVFADHLNIPLSFELGDGGVYVSEQPSLVFLKDNDGDGKADERRVLLTGFGTEDSHHALHDFAWTPDGDLIFRDSIFLHSQVETAYGPVRMQNSGWWRYEPKTERLIAFGTYHSTNPWGVTFDDWGQHVASHPVYAAAFHALNPPYPEQHATPSGLQAYSGVCGQEFVDFPTFPDEMQGGFVKVRYKPTNRVEIHKWVEGEFGYQEQYVSDLLFSTNLSFIPVDIRFGPRGDLYICDWYNPVKGHQQYSLRDDRRDRTSGRIWRVTTKGKPLVDAPKIAGAPIGGLLDLLKQPEYRWRYWAKRELRERDPKEVKAALDQWVEKLDPNDSRFRHHQIEAIWTYRWIREQNLPLLRDLLACDNYHARAAAVQQLRYWHPYFEDVAKLLKSAANDPKGIVRMEAAIACSWVGTKDALEALLDVAKHPREGSMDWAFQSSLGSAPMRKFWENNPAYASVPDLMKTAKRKSSLEESQVSAQDANFDAQKGLQTVRIGCVPERMQFTETKIVATPGQPLKIVFSNPDATDHNFVLVKPEAMEEVGMAANDMAKDPANANSDFIPPQKKSLILQATPLIGPTRAKQVQVLRFKVPAEPGVYPYICTFPGHWVMMNGVLVVASDAKQADELLAARVKPPALTDWKYEDLAADSDAVSANKASREAVGGMKAFMKAQCSVCHALGGHGPAVGPDLSKIGEKYKGQLLLKQILDPSAEVAEQYKVWRIETQDGDELVGSIVQTDNAGLDLIQNPLAPKNVTHVAAKDIKRKVQTPQSPMPQGLLSVLSKDEILDLLAFLESGGVGGGAAMEHHGH